MKLPEIINVLIEKIKKDYTNDISIVYVYGSYLYDDFHSLSDIDLYIITKTNRGNNLGFTFILNGIGYDFWTVSWEWVERVANYDERSPSLVTEGEVVYYGSEDDLTRFNKLREKALVIDKEKYMQKAVENIKNVYKRVFLINNSDDLIEIRKQSIGFIYEISSVLSQINCKDIKRQRKHFKDEITVMENIPSKFEKYYETLFTSNNVSEIKGAINYLSTEIDKIIEKQTKNNETVSFKEIFGGWYEEMIQHYNKIYHACDTNDYYTALFASVELTAELDDKFIKIGISPRLPNMVENYNHKNLNKMKLVAQEHQKQIEQLLVENNIEIKGFKDIEELKKYIKKL